MKTLFALVLTALAFQGNTQTNKQHQDAPFYPFMVDNHQFYVVLGAHYEGDILVQSNYFLYNNGPNGVGGIWIQVQIVTVNDFIVTQSPTIREVPNEGIFLVCFDGVDCFRFKRMRDDRGNIEWKFPPVPQQESEQKSPDIRKL